MTKQRDGKHISKERAPATELNEAELEKATAGSISLSYSAIKVTYTPQKPDGQT